MLGGHARGEEKAGEALLPLLPYRSAAQRSAARNQSIKSIQLRLCLFPKCTPELAINTRYQHSLLTLAIDTRYQHSLSTLAISTRYRHSLSTLARYRRSLSTLAISTRSLSTLAISTRYLHSLSALAICTRYQHSLSTLAISTRYRHSLYPFAPNRAVRFFIHVQEAAAAAAKSAAAVACSSAAPAACAVLTTSAVVLAHCVGFQAGVAARAFGAEAAAALTPAGEVTERRRVVWRWRWRASFFFAVLGCAIV